MKKIILLALSTMMLTSLVACSTKKEEAPAEASTELTQIANPWSDCESLEEAEKIAGFTYNYTESVAYNAFQATGYRAMKGMLEIIYQEDDRELTIRQAPGEGQDISGDTTEYSHDFTVYECGIDEIRLRGTKDIIYEADFSYDGYSYNICTDFADYDTIGILVGELTGQDYADQEIVEDDVNVEGSPTPDDNQRIDEKAIPVGDIAGSYVGETYPECSVSIYSDREEDSAEVGNVMIEDSTGEIVFEGLLLEMADNYYGFADSDATLSVYTEDGKIYLDFYSDGEHVDYFEMTEHYES